MSEDLFGKLKAKTKGFIDNSPLEFIKRPLFTICGNRELIAQGNISVDKYGDTEMKVQVGKLYVTVCGRELTMCFYNRHTVKLAGYITDINFSE